MPTRKPKQQTGFKYLVSSPPVAARCKLCDTWVMSCWVHGMRYQLDLVAVNGIGEAMALILGARTFELNVLGRDKPYQRTAFHIEAGLPKYGHVHAEHRCGMSYDHYRDGRRIFENESYDDPPF